MDIDLIKASGTVMMSWRPYRHMTRCQAAKDMIERHHLIGDVALQGFARFCAMKINFQLSLHASPEFNLHSCNGRWRGEIELNQQDKTALPKGKAKTGI